MADKKFELTDLASGKKSLLPVKSGTIGPDVLDIAATRSTTFRLATVDTNGFNVTFNQPTTGQGLTKQGVGVLRSRDSMATSLGVLDALASSVTGDPRTKAWETTNLHAVATVLAANAKMRKETRGSHWREDFPERDDARMSGHVDVTLGPDGLALTLEHAEPSDRA